MKRELLLLKLAGGILLALASCSSTETTSNALTNEGGIQGDLSDYSKGWSVGTDESGNPQMQSDRRSSYEGGAFSAGGSAQGRKSFATDRHGRKSYSGNTRFDSKQYSGAKAARGYDKSPWFLQQNAKLAKQANASDKNFGTGNFATSSNSSSANSYRTGSNAYTNSRKNNTPQPRVVSGANQHDLTVEDTRTMLGR